MDNKKISIYLAAGALISYGGYKLYQKYKNNLLASCCTNCNDPGCVPVRKCTLKYRCENCNCELKYK